MGIMETDEWLEEDYRQPAEICSRFSHLFFDEDPGLISRFLQSHGMYSPGIQTAAQIKEMKRADIWARAGKIYNKLRKTWGGPDVPVFIFPLRSGGLFQRAYENKSGLAFADKLFLFVRPAITTRELMALIIHEYHHVCRIAKLGKEEADFTLLDTMVMEGFAEYAVSHYLGKEEQANWTLLYTDEELKKAWETHFQMKHSIKREDPLHDKLLLGGSSYPRLIGYSVGYYMVRRSGPYEIKSTFTLPSESLLKGIK